MLESTRRYDLLRSRLRGFTRSLPRLKSADTRGAAGAWVAVRRLREVLPILQLHGPSVQKQTTKLRRIVRRVEVVRQSDALLGLLDEVLERERRGRLAASRVRDSLEQEAKRARTELFRKRVGHDVRRVAARLTDQLETLQAEGDNRTQVRDLQWAVRARVARRAADSENRDSGRRVCVSRVPTPGRSNRAAKASIWCRTRVASDTRCRDRRRPDADSLAPLARRARRPPGADRPHPPACRARWRRPISRPGAISTCW